MEFNQLLFCQFRFSNKADVLLMVFGTIAAIGHGAAVPLQFIIFGDLIDSFINYAIAPDFDIEAEMTQFAFVLCLFGHWKHDCSLWTDDIMVTCCHSASKKNAGDFLQIRFETGHWLV